MGTAIPIGAMGIATGTVAVAAAVGVGVTVHASKWAVQWCLEELGEPWATSALLYGMNGKRSTGGK
jgi:hypothetical protein